MPRSSKSTSGDYVFARATASLSQPGTVFKFSIIEGRQYWASHPAVLAHPSSFSDRPLVILPVDWVAPDAPVEQATAAPGEVRNTDRA